MHVLIGQKPMFFRNIKHKMHVLMFFALLPLDHEAYQESLSSDKTL